MTDVRAAIKAKAHAIQQREDEIDAIHAELAEAAELADFLMGAVVPLRCMDCRAIYADFPLDTTVPDEQWAMIHPSGGGVLCASCIVKRAAKLPGIIAVRAWFEFAPDAQTKDQR